MEIDVKTNMGDIIASVDSLPGTFNDIVSRFNIPEHLFETVKYGYIIPLIMRLINNGYLRECQNGKIRVTKEGKRYIKEHGYLD